MPRCKVRKPVSLSDPRFGDLGAPVEVRRHPKARRLTLRVSRTRRAVVVTLPTQCDLGEAGSFVHRNIDWVRERLCSLPEPVPFRDNVCMPFLGTPHRVVFDPTRRDVRVVANKTDGQMFPELRVGGPIEDAPHRLRDWLFEQARCALDQRVTVHTSKLGVRATRISVRDQVSRWGSCSTTGALSFSWRLIMAPPIVLDYVAAHEVAHLAEMNHGPKFWALVEKTMPEMERAKEWLTVYGMDLHRYGAGENL